MRARLGFVVGGIIGLSFLVSVWLNDWDFLAFGIVEAYVCGVYR